MNAIQTDWLDYPMANARRTDPRSSHLAAARAEATGMAGAQRVAAFGAVRAWPGSTSQELSDRTGLDRYMLARRLPELRKQRIVTNCGQRECRVTGKLATTWTLTA